MGFLDRILGPQLGTVGNDSNQKNPQHWLVDWWGGGGATASGERVNEQTALACAAVKAAVSLLAQTMGRLPLMVHKRMPGGATTPAPEAREWRMLHDEPNKHTSSFIFRETLQGHLGTYGNGYAEIVRAGNGMPVELLQRSPKPAETRPEINDNGELVYVVHDARGQRQPDIRSEDMLHIPGFGFDGLIGYSPIHHLSEVIGAGLGATKFGGEIYRNSLQPSGFVSIPEEMGQEAFDRTRKAFNPKPTDGKRHRIGLLEGGATFAQTSMKPEDVQMIASQRYGVEEVARAYHIPLQLLQDLTNGTSFASVVELGKEFLLYTLDPWIARWEGEINRKVLKGTGLIAKFNTRAFLSGDHKARSEFYLKLFRIGAITDNEIRGWEDLPSMGPAGDIHFVSRDLVPVEFAAREPEPQTPPTPPTAPPAGRGPNSEEQQAPPQPTLAISERIKQQWLLRRASADAVNKELIRMLNKEAKAAKRAAGSPGTMLSWVDEFYAKHALTLHDAVGPSLDVCRMSGADVALTSYFIDEHVERSKADLLAATECKASELLASVSKCVDGWLLPEGGRFLSAKTDIEYLIGETGPQGVHGTPGKDGTDGAAGKDGTGEKGDQGRDGRDGTDGDAAHITVLAELKEPDRIVTHERDANGLLKRSFTREVSNGIS